MKRTGIFLFNILPLYLLIGGCTAPGPIPLTLHFERDSSLPAPSSESSDISCLVEIDSVEDIRSNKESIGTINRNPVLTRDVTEWVREGLHQQTPEGMHFSWYRSSSYPDASNGIGMKVFVSRIFVHDNLARYHGAVVLKVQYRFDENNSYAIERTYRGDGDIFVWSIETAIKKALNDALSNVVLKVNSDLKTFCLNPERVTLRRR